MLNIEIEDDIYRLQKQLDGYKSKKRNAKSDQDDIGVFVDKLKKKKREVEEGLQETVYVIEQKVSRINSKSKFGLRYMENAKRFLYNSKSSMAIQEILDAQKKAERKYWDLDDKISYYDNQIREIENEINYLKQQLI